MANGGLDETRRFNFFDRVQLICGWSEESAMPSNEFDG
jgi:hypothetical protein